ncbi:metallophosphoesterase [Sphingomonas oryzagri]|uniref:Metallophosphoesterase family protein n=1 Tax=Sphingomonas oryzagri TaxID=3042314 RepID=A0ABT6N037_9SPHN|nr:metallophosphoesterase [Sphingomonas oryzagri]MDH7638671.1 metallophosphoesterase family protein [Sphingomonas oryzagri]
MTAIWLLLLHMLLLGSAPPLVRHVRLHMADWPAGAAPMRIALLSDFHVAMPGDSATHLAHVVESVNGSHPDLVLLAGDFLSTGTLFVKSADVRDAIAPLAAFHAPSGVFAVLGNHDEGARAALQAALATSRVALLHNAAVRRGPLTIVGIDGVLTARSRMRAPFSGFSHLAGPKLVFTHTPDNVPQVDRSFRLLLAGHTHCGQIAPWPIGPILTASATGRRYACGVIREPDRLTIVTAGLGTSSLPVRLGATPDYWLIDLGR